VVLASGKKKEAMASFMRHDKDTGSPEVQISIITGRINQLTEHFKKHKKDFHSRRGLLMLVNKRRKLLNYLKSANRDSYQSLIETLGLRK